MYVLTLWQPWATLYAAGLKKIETRPRGVSYTGTILIHAAARMDSMQKNLCRIDPFASHLQQIGVCSYQDLPTGAIIGAVDLLCCKRIVASSDEGFLALFEQYAMAPPEEPEFSYGDYSPGRYAWIGENHRHLLSPLPYKNGQGYYQRFKGDGSRLIFK